MQIPNFVGNSPVEVTAVRNPTCGPLVSIRQDAGAMSFLHSMRPEQAELLAALLLEAAASLTNAVREVAHAE